jgi:phosphoribosylformylglycinamidine synthase
VGGNVSLYNETEDGPIYPTPVVGLVGELPDPATVPGLAPAADDRLALIGPFAPSLAGSELAKLRGELGPGLPGTDLGVASAALAFVREIARGGKATAITDVAEGGLATALAELAIAGEVGLDVDLDALIEARGCSGETALFGEGPVGFVVAAAPEALDSILAAAAEAGVDAVALGGAGGAGLEISAAEAELSLSIADAARAWRSLAERMGEPVAA